MRNFDERGQVADAEIVKAGHVVCGALDAEPTVKSVAAALTRHKYRYTAAQRSIFMRDSIAAYCPQSAISFPVPSDLVRATDQRARWL